MEPLPDLLLTPDGVEVAVHDLGGPDGPAPVLLVAHATGFHGLVYRPLVDAGLTARFRCIAADLRGHGDSVVPDDVDYSWPRFGADVAAVAALAHTIADGQPVFGFGHSMGGAALVLAELDAPGTFAGLFLFEPIIPPSSWLQTTGLDNPLAAAAERRRSTFDSYEAAIANYQAKPPLQVFDPAALDAYVRGGFAAQADGTVQLKCAPAVEAQVFRMAITSDAFDRLASIGCPTTVGVGRAETAGPVVFGPMVAEGVPDGHLVPFEGLGHFGPQQAPGVVAEAVLAAFG